MAKILSSLAALLALLTSALPAAAQSADAPLNPVSAVRVEVRGLNEASGACGLEAGRIGSEFTQSVVEAGLEISGTSPYLLSLAATSVVYLEEHCVTSLTAEVILSGRYNDPISGRPGYGTVRLWTTAGLIASTRDNHTRLVYLGYRDLGRGLADDWRSDRAAASPIPADQ